MDDVTELKKRIEQLERKLAALIDWMQLTSPSSLPDALITDE